jgi:acyl-CoA synthetase (AMP-forming)/AMP-acid ligase II
MMGSSENCSIAFLPRSLHRPDGTAKEQARLLSVGFPYAGVGIRIVDEEGRDCPVNERGEVALKSPAMFRGYWNNSIATIESVRSGGENIYSREGEEAIVQHPAVFEVAVIGLPDETWGETVCAAVVLAAGASATEAELIEHTRSLIASYKKPRTIRFVSGLPKVASGKVDKKVLRAEFAVATVPAG